MPDDLLSRAGIVEVIAPGDVTIFCAEHAEAIRVLGRRVVGDIIEIGNRLIAVREALPHGEWLPWLDGEFGWKQATAYNFIAAAEAFAEVTTIGSLPIDAGALYLLAGPTVPPAAREAAIELAETGERITKADAERLVVEAKTNALEDLKRQLADREADVRAEYDGKLIMSAADLQARIDKGLAPITKRIERLTADRDKALERVKKLLAKKPKPAPKAASSDLPPIDGTISFRAMCIRQAVESLKGELRITPQQYVAIEREAAERIHKQPIEPAFAAFCADARQVIAWLEKTIGEIG